MPAFDDIMGECLPLVGMGAALLWLRHKSKAPIDEGWTTAPRASLDDLKASFPTGSNVGIRLGSASSTPYGFIHVIDLDIRSVECEAEAWIALLKLIPEARTLPSVVSGSGGCSRHLYFLSTKALKSRKLIKSKAFNLVYDPKKQREVKKSAWEIDLFGTGKQVVLPPSIHPDTGQPYRWERKFEFDLMDLGIRPLPLISSESSAEWAIESPDLDDDDDDDLGTIVRQMPMDLDDEEIDRIIARLPEEWVDDRDEWIKVGAALSHQYEGRQEGFDRWCDWSRQSEKFDMRTQKASWKSFRGASNPIRMASLIQAGADNRLQQNLPGIKVESPDADPLLALIGPPSGTVGDQQEAAKVPVLQDWTSLLDRNEDGFPRSCLLNTKLIAQNDPRTFGILAFNEFKQGIVLLSPPRIASRTREENRKPMLQLEGDLWKVSDPVNGTDWTDSHESSLRMIMEAPKTQGGYNIKVTDRDMRAAVDMVANDNRYHPVRQYLSQHTWDGVKRMATLFIDFLGCDDTPYHRECAELILLGAVARAFEPGHKFDFVPILEGVQGKRKSTFISILGRGWFSELAGDFHNNQGMVEQILGSWIVEIPELQGFSRADTNVLKAWVSRTKDKVRLPYEKRARTFSRQCIFIGSTNDDTYLRDHTGGRRFWPIRTNLEGEIDTDRLLGIVDQLWAEAVARYHAMRKQIKLPDLPLYLTSEAAKQEAKVLQDSRRIETVEDSLAGNISKWLEEPIGTDAGFDDLEPDAPKVYRNFTCSLQVWVEMMGNEVGRMNVGDQTRIGMALARVPGWVKAGHLNTKKYGKQRVYVRFGYGGTISDI